MIKTSPTNKLSSWRTRALSVGLVLSLLAPLTLLLVASMIPAADASPGPGWWNSSWIYRKEIVIDHTKVDGNLDNFPVLISITDSDLAADAQNNGDDITFTDNEGNQLNHEIEYFDGSNGTLVAWVRILHLYNNENVSIYMYYGNLSAPNQENPTGVWDDNYVAVWHMKDNATSSILDSTSNNNDGTKKAANEPIQIDGKFSKAQNFDGSNDYIQIPDDESQHIKYYITLEAWINVDDATNWRTIMSKFPEGTAIKDIYWYLYSDRIGI
jgi:hypothetical protein